ncbi:hypothetical protein [Klebsiella pneumoniae IS53]|uniref:Uncharacterized protein n=1 Tax=Klebsiella pneumoniae IS43 TaxID=1432552 RepID=W1DCZ6_KLEPN|nr:hypothetical protein [Klebsiella pneumoniae IS43]CDL23686.1 hypothetical protein [Klebsiella pneumoniae IS53]
MLATGSIARITVARIRGYSPGKKNAFYQIFYAITVYVISQNGLNGGE